MVQNIKKSKMPKNDATKLKIGTQTDQIILNTIAFFSRKYRNFFFDLAVFPPEGGIYRGNIMDFKMWTFLAYYANLVHI